MNEIIEMTVAENRAAPVILRGRARLSQVLGNWQMYGDLNVPPPDPNTIDTELRPLSPAVQVARIHDQAEVAFEQRPIIRQVLQEATRQEGRGAHFGHYSTELEAVSVLMAAGDARHQDKIIPTEVGLRGSAIYRALKVMRPVGTNASTFYGFLAMPNAADRIAADFAVYSSEHLQHLPPDEARVQSGIYLDTCILTALGCGDVKAALELVERADKFVSKISLTEREVVQTELARTLNDARNIYTTDMQLRWDLVVSQRGPKSEQTAAAGRVVDVLTQKRNIWYGEQEAVRMSDLVQNAHPDALASVIEALVMRDGQYEDLYVQIERIAGEIELGRITNAMGAELVRRLHPELTVMAIKQAQEAQSVGDIWNTAEVRNYPHRNELAMVYDIAVSPAQAVGDIKVVPERVRTIALNPNELQYRDFVAFVKDPGAFIHYLNQGLNSDALVPQQRLRREELVSRLWRAVMFYDTLARSDLGEAVLGRQLGFSQQELSVGHIDSFYQYLQEFVGGHQHLRLFAHYTASQQIAADRSTIEQIRKSLPDATNETAAEVHNLAIGVIEQKRAEQRNIIAQAAIRLPDAAEQAEIKRIQANNELRTPHHRALAHESVAAAERKLAEAKAMVPFRGKGLRKAGAVTQQDIDTAIEVAQTMLTAAEATLRDVMQEPEPLPNRAEAIVKEAGDRVKKLNRLKPVSTRVN